VLSTASLPAGLVIVAFLGLYLAAEPEVYFSGIRRATPGRYRGTLEACAAGAVRNLRWWLLAQMLSMAAVGTLVALGLWALGVPLAGTLGRSDKLGSGDLEKNAAGSPRTFGQPDYTGKPRGFPNYYARFNRRDVRSTASAVAN